MHTEHPPTLSLIKSRYRWPQDGELSMDFTER